VALEPTTRAVRASVQLGVARLLKIGILASGTGVVLTLVALTVHSVPAHAQYDDCGFPPYIDDRRIALRQHISCSEAKRVLLRLKGDRPSRTVPMVCRRSRVVQGWRLSKGSGRAFNVVMTQYRRGKASFLYQRVQTPGREWCRPPGGSGEPIG